MTPQAKTPKAKTPKAKMPKAKMPRAMTQKERRFVAEYLVDLNATKAAKRAGYETSRYAASRLARRADVAAAIADAIAARRLRAQLTADRVLQEYARIAFADIRRIADFGSGHLKVHDGSLMEDDDAAAIAQVTPAAGGKGGVRVKLYDKKSALDAIARHLGLFGAPRTHGQQPPGVTTLVDPRLAAQQARLILRERLAKLVANGNDSGNGNGAT